MKKEIKIDGRKVIKTVGKGLQFAARIGASKLTKDILSKAVSENISKNLFVQIGMYGVAGYVGSKAAEFIEEKVDSYIDLIDLYVKLKEASENAEVEIVDLSEMEKENEKAN